MSPLSSKMGGIYQQGPPPKTELFKKNRVFLVAGQYPGPVRKLEKIGVNLLPRKFKTKFLQKNRFGLCLFFSSGWHNLQGVLTS